MPEETTLDVPLHALHFTVVGVPVSQKNQKKIMRNKRTGKVWIGTEMKMLNWKKAAVRQLQKQYTLAGPLAGEVRADVLIFQGKKQAIDSDNVLGSLFDALEAAGILKNDYQLSEGSWRRDRDRERPRVEVQLRPIG